MTTSDPMSCEHNMPRSKVSRLLPWLIAMAFFMQMLDGTILNNALPAMARDLGESPLRMQAVVISYVLSVALLIPASGWISDRFGSRRVFFVAIALFMLGSLLCAQSETLSMLITSRVVQGGGGALMVPVGRLVILRVYPRSELVQKLSFVTMPALIGPLIGPTLGGWLVDYASWHWIFLINVPIGILGCFLTLRLMPDLRSPVNSPFDIKGFILFSAGLVLIHMAFEGLGDRDVTTVESLIVLALGLGCLCSYWLYALWSKDAPLFSLKLFENRTFTAGILGNMFARLGSGALPFLTPLFFQLGLGFSPTKAGMTMIPLAVAGMIGKVLIKHFLDRLGYRLFLMINTIFLGLMIAGFSQITIETPYWFLLGYLFVMGGINSMQFTAMNTVALIDLRDVDASSGNSLLSVIMQLGISLGVASASVLLSSFRSYGTPDVDAAIHSFHGTYLCIGLVSMIAAVIFLQLPRDSGRAAREGAPEPEHDTERH